MAVSLKRKLYSRGGSFETTVPMQLLFALDLDKRHDVVFEFDKKTNRWYIDFVEDKNIGKKTDNRKSTGGAR